MIDYKTQTKPTQKYYLTVELPFPTAPDQSKLPHHNIDLFMKELYPKLDGNLPIEHRVKIAIRGQKYSHTVKSIPTLCLTFDSKETKDQCAKILSSKSLDFQSFGNVPLKVW